MQRLPPQRQDEQHERQKRELPRSAIQNQRRCRIERGSSPLAEGEAARVPQATKRVTQYAQRQYLIQKYRHVVGAERRKIAERSAELAREKYPARRDRRQLQRGQQDCCERP